MRFWKNSDEPQDPEEMCLHCHAMIPGRARICPSAGVSGMRRKTHPRPNKRSTEHLDPQNNALTKLSQKGGFLSLVREL